MLHLSQLLIIKTMEAVVQHSAWAFLCWGLGELIVMGWFRIFHNYDHKNRAFVTLNYKILAIEYTTRLNEYMDTQKISHTELNFHQISKHPRKLWKIVQSWWRYIQWNLSIADTIETSIPVIERCQLHRGLFQMGLFYFKNEL